jgi:hypothetical protein
MASDSYVKALLSVIAGCLLWLCAMMSGLPVAAQQFGAPTTKMLIPGPAQPVVIVGWGTMTPQGQVALRFVTDADGAVHTDANLAVKVEQDVRRPIPVTLGPRDQQPLPVAITAIRPGADWEPIRAKIEMAKPQPLPGVQ